MAAVFPHRDSYTTIAFIAYSFLNHMVKRPYSAQDSQRTRTPFVIIAALLLIPVPPTVRELEKPASSQNVPGHAQQPAAYGQAHYATECGRHIRLCRSSPRTSG